MGKTRPCRVCGTEVSIFRVPYHEKICTGVYSHKKTIDFEIAPDGRRICPDCKELFHKYGIATHWRMVHRGDPPPSHKGRTGWNKGRTASTDERVRKNVDAARQGVIDWISKMTPEERKSNFGKVPVGHRMGGVRHGSGRGKKGWYEGFWCDSSWELAWVIYAIDHSMTFTRNIVGYSYEFEGVRRKFYPDFLLASGDLIEVKGYLDPRNKAKIAAVEGLKVLGKKEMQVFIRYAIEKFGSNFVSVAYQQPPEHKCIDCGKPVSKLAPRCQKCSGRKNKKFKIDWPSDKDLIEMIGKSNKNQVAKNLGVSFNAVAKRLKLNGLVAPM